AALGESPYRAAQIFAGLYRRRWDSWDRFTDLSLDLRARLAEAADLRWPEIQDSAGSADGSTKHAFRLEDGALVEGVHMPYGGRTTLCLSSQVGCAMGCTFCATGAMGIRRNLSAGEIVGQVIALIMALGPGRAHSVTLVFMGMGEPLHNLDNVHRAIRVLNHPAGLNI